jgi:predicted benzoate:H+ symporter BenE
MSMLGASVAEIVGWVVIVGSVIVIVGWIGTFWGLPRRVGKFKK